VGDVVDDVELREVEVPVLQILGPRADRRRLRGVGTRQVENLEEVKADLVTQAVLTASSWRKPNLVTK
jgi:hypothetical protein